MVVIRNLYEITPTGSRLVYTSRHTANYMTLDTDTQGHVYLLGYASTYVHDAHRPAFVSKLDADFQLLWETVLPDDAYVADLGHFVISDEGDVHLIDKQWEGGFRLQSIEGDTGALRQRELGDIAKVEVLGAAPDNGLYIVKRINQGGNIYQAIVEEVNAEGSEVTVLSLAGDDIYAPIIRLDFRHGFIVKSFSTKLVGSYQGGIQRKSDTESLEIYTFDGMLKKKVSGKGNVYSERNGMVLGNEQIGESFSEAQSDGIGALYTLVGNRYQDAETQPTGLDYSIYYRKY